MKKNRKITLILFAVIFFLGIISAIHYCCINNHSAMFANIVIILLSFMCFMYELISQTDDAIIKDLEELDKINIEHIKILKRLSLKQEEIIETLKAKDAIQQNIIEKLKKIDNLNN